VKWHHGGGGENEIGASAKNGINGVTAINQLKTRSVAAACELGEKGVKPASWRSASSKKNGRQTGENIGINNEISSKRK
jgi:hypothetical protein